MQAFHAGLMREAAAGARRPPGLVAGEPWRLVAVAMGVSAVVFGSLGLMTGFLLARVQG